MWHQRQRNKKRSEYILLLCWVHIFSGVGGGGRGVSVTYIWKGWFLVELEFGHVGYWGEGKTVVPGEKPLGAKERNNKKLKLHMASTPGFELGPHWWKASTLTTSPLRHPCSPCVIVLFSPQKLVHLFLLKEVNPFPDCNIIKFLTFNNLFSPLWHSR